MRIWTVAICLTMMAQALPAGAQTPAATSVRPPLALGDVFELEWASDPQISPDGHRIVFARIGFDIMKDAERSRLWMVNADGSDLRPIRESVSDAHAPRWSPDGKRLLFVSRADSSSEIFVRWMDSGQEAVATHVRESPGNMAWSPDGKWIAFTMFVPSDPEPMIRMPDKPNGADWGPPIKVIDDLEYRGDGQGYLRSGHRHIFVIPASGGTPRQLTSGDFDDGAPVWAPDGSSLVFSANRHEDPESHPLDTDIYSVRLVDAVLTRLTTRDGPEQQPAVSPDGKLIAYTGFDDRLQGYQVSHLYVANRDGSGARLVTAQLDRDIDSPAWSRDGKGLFIQYDEHGDTRVGYVTLNGEVTMIASGIGGLSLGRPYSGGSYSVSEDGRVAYTLTSTSHPADVGVVEMGEEPDRLTDLNEDLFSQRSLSGVEEIWYPSSFDQRRIQGWIVKPPGFDASRKYPLLLEIHGGPFANYGSRFAAEIQLYAAAGYVVLYTNPRGSTSYGEEFGNLIHHDYPNHDFDDLMTGVDSLIGRGYIDPQQLFVTGGSGGGVLTAWIVGHTDRFKAAVVQKPVINWTSFVLTSDATSFFYKYWFPGFPWDNPEQYAKRSPLTYVGNVTTPTMMMTGEVDYRTPSGEAEQFYTALKLRKVPSVMVRVPDASHEIASRPSNLIAKVAYILAWFSRYGGTGAATP
jgi:acylaminoacyl-peptidase